MALVHHWVWFRKLVAQQRITLFETETWLLVVIVSNWKSVPLQVGFCSSLFNHSLYSRPYEWLCYLCWSWKWNGFYWRRTSDSWLWKNRLPTRFVDIFFFILHPFTFSKNIFTGSATKLYKSVHSKILSLPDHFKLFPAHDYKGFTSTTVQEEKQFNPRLTKSEDEFIEIMNNLGLDYPKMIGLF